MPSLLESLNELGLCDYWIENQSDLVLLRKKESNTGRITLTNSAPLATDRSLYTQSTKVYSRC
jgi:hypothetical protein